MKLIQLEFNIPFLSVLGRLRPMLASFFLAGVTKRLYRRLAIENLSRSDLPSASVPRQCVLWKNHSANKLKIDLRQGPNAALATPARCIPHFCIYLWWVRVLCRLSCNGSEGGKAQYNSKRSYGSESSSHTLVQFLFRLGRSDLMMTAWW